MHALIYQKVNLEAVISFTKDNCRKHEEKTSFSCKLIKPQTIHTAALSKYGYLLQYGLCIDDEQQQ